MVSSKWTWVRNYLENNIKKLSRKWPTLQSHFLFHIVKFLDASNKCYINCKFNSTWDNSSFYRPKLYNFVYLSCIHTKNFRHIFFHIIWSFLKCKGIEGIMKGISSKILNLYSGYGQTWALPHLLFLPSLSAHLLSECFNLLYYMTS